MKRRALHRGVFAAAALYNIFWGLYAAVDPQWLFRFAGMPPLNQPALFSCLGMVIGVYGLLYAEVARRPEHGFALAAVGLLGKVLGPIGLALLILQGEWPRATLVLCLTNDFIWWVPFSLYLWDAWPHYRRTFSPA
ncbi:hypothetical protein JRI60_09685 [Archangium violaceum]|uniref:hypothetical protein n=1 Tax=Archangium violaceum TaxID=83451 RepID=UPI001951F445|nr:hypothetical protein [Archangium violaceum]QRN99262.1 hypothetical protein JRI60_09685 [Archangium violaceum]